MKRTPTDEQIKKVNDIASFLDIDFPQSSKDFSYKLYQKFIDKYEDIYKEQVNLALENNCNRDELI